MLALTIDGKSVSVNLTDGTYNPQALAQMLEGAINGSSDLNGRHVAVGVQNGALSITSNTYGSTSQVAVGTGTANTPLGLTAGQGAQGRDVAGSFVVDGKTEAATGSGQLLTGVAGNANTDGMEVRVTADCHCEEPDHVHFHCCGQELRKV